MISGSAAFRAARAAVLSPLAMASSTLRMKPRTRVLREVLIAVRLAVVRTRLRDEAILGMGLPGIGKRGGHIARPRIGVNKAFWNRLFLTGRTIEGRAPRLNDAFDGSPAGFFDPLALSIGA